MAEKCRSQFSSSTSTTNSSVTTTTKAAKNFLNTVEIQIIPQKSSSNQNLLQSTTVNYSSIDNLEEPMIPITTPTTTLHDIISDNKSNDAIIESSSSSSSSSFIADDEIIREEFYETILKDNVDDGDDESRTNSTTNNDNDDDDDDDNIIEQSNQLLIEHEQHDNINGIYLETPIVDENNICMNVVHDFENTKPKRISDDFFSSDDGDDGPSIVSSSCETNSAITAAAGHLSNIQSEENSIENFLQVSSREYLEEEEDTSSSLCSNLMSRLGNNSNRNNESHVLKTTTTTTTSSSITSSDNLVVIENNSDKKLNINDNDTHPTTSSKSTLAKFYHDHDVQSMDAIERRDFKHEQILTGGVIIKASSLVKSDDKINLEFIKSYKESGSNSSRIVRRSLSDSKSSQQKDHSTTPTSSRRSSIRLTKSAPKINLSATLDRLDKKKVESIENKNEHENLACSSGNSSSIRGESSSSVLPSSSTMISSASASSSSLSSTLPHYSRVTKFDMFLNSNSNDSLSSDKSYNTSSNHSLRNFFSKSNSGDNNSNNNELFYVSASDDANSHKNLSSKTIKDNQKILEDNDTSSDQGVYSSEPMPSTSRQQHSSKCHYSNFCCNDNIIKTTTNIQKDDISTVLKNSKDVTSKLTTFSDRKNTPSTSSNTTPSQLINREICSNYNIEELYPNISTNHQQQQSLREMESHKFEERAVEGLSSSSHMPTVNSEHIENEFDDETWADCEEGSDEEICTCHNNDYPLDTTATEDDLLPSRDVDLSGYIQMVSISEDMFLQDNSYLSDIPSSMQRKRKLNDNRMQQDGESPFASESSNGRKRIAFDCSSTPRSSQQHILTVSSPSTPMERRTPRSLIPTKDNPPPELQDWLLQFQRWSHAERLLAVDRLIEHCEPTQVRHMMKVIEPQFQRDFISLLPKELALQVLSYLEPKDLLRAAQTCRSWRFLCDDNLLWKEKCRQAQIIAEPKTDRPKRGRAGNMPPISSPWKAAYMRQHIIEMNWRSRPIRQPKILKGHDDHVITCLQFSGNRIVSGSDDNTLKVWSAVTGKCLRTLVGHTGGVWSSQMSGNIIISGSTDRTLKVWNMETGQCIHTLLGHTSTVRCMHLHGKKVVSGSRDATLRVWDIEQGTCLHVLVGHLAAVRCVQYDGKLIVSGAYDYMVKVWHPERQECLHTLQGHTNRVYSLQFDGIHVVSGSLDTSIRVWDAETGNCKHTLMGHQSLTSGMELRQNILVSGNADSTVKVWDITTGQCLQTLSGPNKHQSAVTCLQFNSRFVITSSDDGTVKLWDVKTGEFIRNLVALDSGGSGGVVWRIRANDTKLICAVGSRNGTEETKLMVLDFDVEGACLKCS